MPLALLGWLMSNIYLHLTLELRSLRLCGVIRDGWHRRDIKLWVFVEVEGKCASNRRPPPSTSWWPLYLRAPGPSCEAVPW